jgi:hypothetical protein
VSREKETLTRLLGWLPHDTSHISIHPTWTACVDNETWVLTRKYGSDCVDTRFADTIALTLVAKARGQFLLVLHSLLGNGQLYS